MSAIGAAVAIQVGTKLVQGFVDKRNAEKEQARRNAAAQARVAWLQEEKKFAKKTYEFQTFSTAFDAASAGTAKIARSASLGSLGAQDSNYLNQFSTALMNRDIQVMKMGHDRQLLRMQNEIDSVASGIRDPGDVGWDVMTGAVISAAGKGVQTFYDQKALQE